MEADGSPFSCTLTVVVPPSLIERGDETENIGEISLSTVGMETLVVVKPLVENETATVSERVLESSKAVKVTV